MIAVGAFDDRIYRTIDVQRLGLRPLGAMRPFIGDNVGALDVRLREDARRDRDTHGRNARNDGRPRGGDGAVSEREAGDDAAAPADDGEPAMKGGGKSAAKQRKGKRDKT
jgi:hypothetical protein